MTGSKGIDLAVKTAIKLKLKLKIVGKSGGYYSEYKKYANKYNNIEFLGYVDDDYLSHLYRNALGLLALSKDEDFGITPVEAMSFGTPVIAFNAGGYKETVVDGKTGLLFDDYSVKGLEIAVNKFNKIKIKPADCISQAEKIFKRDF